MSFRKERKIITDDYLTDPQLIKELGPFNTDPCCLDKMPWRTAKRMLTKKDNGLTSKWTGTVWLNPPYSKPLPWIERFIEHGNGIILVPGRSPETAWCQLLYEQADLFFYPRGRFVFFLKDGSPSAGKWQPNLLAAMGGTCVKRLLNLPRHGVYLERL